MPELAVIAALTLSILAVLTVIVVVPLITNNIIGGSDVTDNSNGVSPFGNNFQAVTVSSTDNIDLDLPISEIDGVRVFPGERVLLRNQLRADENGIYIVRDDGTLMRAPDLTETEQVVEGTTVYTILGSSQQGATYVLQVPRTTRQKSFHPSANTNNITPTPNDIEAQTYVPAGAQSNTNNRPLDDTSLELQFPIVSDVYLGNSTSTNAVLVKDPSEPTSTRFTDTLSLQDVSANTVTVTQVFNVNGQIFPSSDGTADQIMTTDGQGTLSWVNQNPGSGNVTGLGPTAINDIVVYDDTSGQVIRKSGGSLNTNGDFIANNSAVIGVSNTGTGVGIDLLPNTSGPRSVRFFEAAINGTQSVSLAAPAFVPADVSFQLPSTDGAPGSTLRTNGSGVLDWFPIPGGGNVVGTGPTTINGLVTYTDVSGELIQPGGATLTANGDLIVNNSIIVGQSDSGDNSSLLLPPFSTVSGSTRALRFQELSTSGTNVVGFKAPDSIPTDSIWTLPTTDGSLGQGLVTNGFNQLSFQTLANVSSETPVSSNQIPIFSDVTGQILQGGGATLNGTGELTLNDAIRVNGSGEITVGEINAGSATGILLQPYSIAAGSTKELRFAELSANGANYVGFKAPDLIASNAIWVLPEVDGTNGQGLITDGSNNLSFQTLANVSGQTPTNVNELAVFTDATGRLIAASGGTLTSVGDLAVNNSGTFGTADSGTALGILLNPFDTTAGSTRELRFAELSTNGSNYLGFKAPDAIANDVIWVLPEVDGTNGQGLITDGSNNLSFQTLSNVSGQTPTNANELAVFTDTTGQLIAASGGTLTSVGDLSVNNSGTFGALNVGTSLGVLLNPFDTAAGSTRELRFAELSANGSNYIGFKAPDTITSNAIWVLPGADGTNGQGLVTDGSNNLTFQTLANVSGETPTNINEIAVFSDTTGQLIAASGGSLSPLGDLSVNNSGTFGTIDSGTALGMLLNPFDTAAGSTRELRFAELSANGSNYIGFKAPDTITSNAIWVLPGADGTNGQGLVTDGSNNLTFQTLANVSGQTPTNINELAVFTDTSGQLLAASGGTLTSAGDLFINNSSTFGSVDSGTALGMLLNPFDTTTGSTRELRFAELSANGSNYIGFKAPDGIANNVIWVLPDADGTNGQGLVTNGSNSLTFQTLANVSGQTPTNINEIAVFSDTTGQLIAASGGSLSPMGDLSVNNSGTFGTVNAGTAAGVLLNPFNTAAGSTRELRFAELSTTGSNYVGFKAPDAIATNVVWILPDSDGTNGQGLITDGSNNLSFQTLANVSGQTPTNVNELAVFTDTSGQLIAASGGTLTSTGDLSVNNSGTFGSTDSGTALGIVLNPFDTTTGSTRELRFAELSANGSNYIGFKAPDSIANDVIWVLPPLDGTTGQGLVTDGSNNLSFQTLANVSGQTPTNVNEIAVFTDTSGQLIAASGGTLTSTGDLSVNNSGTFGALNVGTSLGLLLNPFNAAAGSTRELRFAELSASGSNYVGFKSPDAIAANVIWILPDSDGTNGQALVTNGSNNLSFQTLANVSGQTPTNTNELAVFTDTSGQLITASGGTLTSVGDLSVNNSGTFGAVNLGTAVGILLNPFNAAAGSTRELRFAELSASGTNYVGLKAPDSIATSTIWVLPPVDGTIGQALITDGSNNLSFQTLANVSGQTPTNANELAVFTDTSGQLIAASGGSLTSAGDLVVNNSGTFGTANSGTALGILLNPFDTIAGSTRELRFAELSANGSNYLGFKAPDSIATNTIWVLPSVDGTTGQALITDGSNNLSFQTLANVSGQTPTNPNELAVFTDTSGQVIAASGGSLTPTGDLSVNNSGTFGTVDSGTAAGVLLNPFSAAAGSTRELRFAELSASGSNYVGLKAPDSMAANTIWVLPDADGTNGQGLVTDGASNLSFQTLANVSGLTPTNANDLVVFSDTTGQLIGSSGGSLTSTGDLLVDNSGTFGVINAGTPLGLLLNPFDTATGSTRELRFAELSTSGSNYVGFKAPDSVVADTIFVLPSADGNVGETLQTNGTGDLSWKLPEAYRISSVFAAGTGDTTGLATGAWITRVMNTLTNDTAFTNVTLVTNQFTVPSGTWMVNFHATGFKLQGHQSRLQNITAATTAILGSTSNSANNGGAVNRDQTISMGNAVLVLTAATTFELQSQAQDVGATGAAWGDPIAWGDNIYAEVQFVRLT